MNTPPPDRIPAEILADLAQAMQNMRDQAAALSGVWIGKARAQ